MNSSQMRRTPEQERRTVIVAALMAMAEWRFLKVEAKSVLREAADIIQKIKTP